jgi:formylglycine-generating enzyme required for sulfatase activity
VDLLGANVGFRHWHPMPVSQYGNKLAGQSEMGGVWEWTSTTLDKHEGFEAMPLYPGYTGKGSLVYPFVKAVSDVSPQPTSSMVSITLCLVDLGQRTRALQDVRACK